MHVEKVGTCADAMKKFGACIAWLAPAGAIAKTSKTKGTDMNETKHNNNPAIYGWRKMVVYFPDTPGIVDVYQLADRTLVFYQYPHTETEHILRKREMTTTTVDPYMFWGPPDVHGRQAQEEMEKAEEQLHGKRGVV